MNPDTIRIPSLTLTLDGDAYTVTYRERVLRGTAIEIVVAALAVDAEEQAIADTWAAKLAAMPEVMIAATGYGSRPMPARIMRTTPTQITLAGYAPDTEGGKFRRNRLGSYVEVLGSSGYGRRRSLVTASLPAHLRVPE